ncbi:MAG: hypothetical protein KatS3mg085_561 [Candidatus Dojkabacteria bacterium]|nr:MAG: hypothetical protein KatS3mg085_561 [Candidatus Dojkabacteria bacterium]
MNDLNNSEVALLNDNKTECLVCENEFEIDFNNLMIEGIENLDQLRKYLQDKPTAIIYYSCPHCLMEYVFKMVGSGLGLELHEEEK